MICWSLAYQMLEQFKVVPKTGHVANPQLEIVDLPIGLFTPQPGTIAWTFSALSSSGSQLPACPGGGER
jgi:hypothetical protein